MSNSKVICFNNAKDLKYLDGYRDISDEEISEFISSCINKLLFIPLEKKENFPFQAKELKFEIIYTMDDQCNFLQDTYKRSESISVKCITGLIENRNENE